MKLSQRLRNAVRDRGCTLRELSERTRIDKATLCRFAAGRGGMLLPQVDRLAVALGLELLARPRKGR